MDLLLLVVLDFLENYVFVIFFISLNSLIFFFFKKNKKNKNYLLLILLFLTNIFLSYILFLYSKDKGYINYLSKGEVFKGIYLPPDTKIWKKWAVLKEDKYSIIFPQQYLWNKIPIHEIFWYNPILEVSNKNSKNIVSINNFKCYNSRVKFENNMPHDLSTLSNLNFYSCIESEGYFIFGNQKIKYKNMLVENENSIDLLRK